MDAPSEHPPQPEQPTEKAQQQPPTITALKSRPTTPGSPLARRDGTMRFQRALMLEKHRAEMEVQREEWERKYKPIYDALNREYEAVKKRQDPLGRSLERVKKKLLEQQLVEQQPQSTPFATLSMSRSKSASSQGGIPTLTERSRSSLSPNVAADGRKEGTRHRPGQMRASTVRGLHAVRGEKSAPVARST